MFQKGEESLWNRLLFASTIRRKNDAHKLAYIAVLTAFIVASNVAEIKFLDNQFSFTIFVAMFSGGVLGAISGFFACLIGDFVGYLIHPAYIYMPWVGLSTGMFALITGLVLETRRGVMSDWKLVLKLLTASLLTFLICTIAINSTGFYYYNKAMGFSDGVVSFIADKFGGEHVTFWAYCIYRLFFKGQIFNSLTNYILILYLVPALNKIKSLRLRIGK
jgi:ECF transporter S component (folate family)